MLNLHPPFRAATGDDRGAIASLGYGAIAADLAGCVVAEEDGALVAVAHGRRAGAVWQIDLLAIAPQRIADLGPRLLAVADACAAEEGLPSVCLNAETGPANLWSLLDREGFRHVDPPEGRTGLNWLGRDVIPAG